MRQTNIKLIDMPGLLVPGSIAEKLTLEDLKEQWGRVPIAVKMVKLQWIQLLNLTGLATGNLNLRRVTSPPISDLFFV